MEVKKECLDAVLLKLRNIAATREVYLSDEDWEETKAFSHCLLREGFSIQDAVMYQSYMEEFNPTIDEDTAIKKMKAIRLKY